MLVLTRKVGEGIVIDNDIYVVILEDKEGRVRIGVEAPKDKKIYRREVYDRICIENSEASQWNMADLNVLRQVLDNRKDQK
ncbi:MAG TPA: carbon storage regulator CsrA [Desulfohalobiaceae bacterium]|nr:carbon storage regulator CsrA [Desulfohalobiaceae bacterium]